MDKSKDIEVLNFFMEDSPWIKPKYVKQKESKKPDEKILRDSNKAQIIQDEEKTIEKQDTIAQVQKIKTNNFEEQNLIENEDTGFGEVDYAILKSITYGFKTINEIAKGLQIRNLVVEKHIFRLIKEGFIKYFQFCVITSQGKNTIEEFEKNNPEDLWKPIDEFIVTVIELRKERNIKLQKTIDLILVISIILLIILVIYFGIF
jgi:hypothetical protein